MNLLRLCSLMLCVCLSGCQLFTPAEEGLDQKAGTLAALQPAMHVQPILLKAPRDQAAAVNVQEVIAHYTELLPLLTDPDKQLKVLHRLADLKLQQGEQMMAEQAIDELDIAISAYLGLLDNYPERAENDRVLYQLAKTYELKGEAQLQFDTMTDLVEQFPQSSYLAEVQFRRGELLFTWSDYVQAQQAFSASLATGDPVFLNNARYMLGWSVFKQADYQHALVHFTHVLEQIFAEQRGWEVATEAFIPVHQKTLVNDLLRVMNLSFSYLEGAQSVVALFNTVGPKHFEVLVYSHYSQWLVDSEQFTNAIAVYQAFIEQHAFSLWAPRYHMNIISTLGQARFTADIHEEKKRFIENYGLGSPFWLYHETNPPMSPATEERDHLAFTREQLESLLIEMADFYYVKGQLADKSHAITPAMQENFARAASYNRQFIATFPLHDAVAKRYFLLGESEFKIQNWLAAIEAFEQAGYAYADFPEAAEAAYASILAYRAFSTEWQQMTVFLKQHWHQQEQANRLRFVAQHPQDQRALDVLFVALSEQFKQKQFELALAHAQQLIDWPLSFEGAPRANPMQLQESYLIKAHSLYALAAYPAAEQAYVVAIANLPAKDARHLALQENLAASVYRQAESLLRQEDKTGAINELLRVGLVAPQSSLRQNAEYDAANYLLELQRWPEAISVLSQFRAAYPQHHLIDTLPAKLALAYRETAQWSLAADELKRMIALAETEQDKQDTLFIVAELYDKAEDKPQAIVSYRAYANRYPEPSDVYMEAANRLAELYEQTNDPIKQRFWLAKQIQKVDKLGGQADDRMRYLAARAASILANDAFIQYKSVRLALPLEKSLDQKTQALEKALKAYQLTASYGIAEFSTQAGYRMAELYTLLSQALMKSERPDDLNELELEQYDILLEEQVFPFEDSAINIHEQNASRAWQGLYDDWVKKSFRELRELLPGRYAKDEQALGGIDALY